MVTFLKCFEAQKQIKGGVILQNEGKIMHILKSCTYINSTIKTMRIRLRQHFEGLTPGQRNLNTGDFQTAGGRTKGPARNSARPNVLLATQLIQPDSKKFCRHGFPSSSQDASLQWQ
jgi:hypothetical protein